MPEYPFHIVIGENHLREISIKTVQSFLTKLVQEKKQDMKNIVVCLEEKNKDVMSFYKMVTPTIMTYYQQAIGGTLPLERINQGNLMTILSGTFGIKRFNAYLEFFEFAKKNNIQVTGIDDSQDRSFAARNNSMAKNLQKFKQQNKSTITVVGINHIADTYEGDSSKPDSGLYRLLNKSIHTPFRFYLIRDITPLPEFPALKNHPLVSRELKTDLNVLDAPLEILNAPGELAWVELIENPDEERAAIFIDEHCSQLHQKKQAFLQKCIAKYQANSAEHALRKAAEKGNYEDIAQLYDHDVSITPGKESGKTALHWAVKNSHIEIVEFLLSIMPKEIIQLKDNAQKTAEDYAKISNNKAIQQLFDKNKNHPLPPLTSSPHFSLQQS